MIFRYTPFKESHDNVYQNNKKHCCNPTMHNKENEDYNTNYILYDIPQYL